MWGAIARVGSGIVSAIGVIVDVVRAFRGPPPAPRVIPHVPEKLDRARLLDAARKIDGSH